jgi:hypothetical protein
MTIRALAADDERAVEARVAGPAALLVAKLHKIGERQESANRLVDKDAYDVYRLLIAVPTQDLATSIVQLLTNGLAGDGTGTALDYLAQLFGADCGVGSVMAGRAEELVGDPAVVAAACAALAGDLLAAIER